MADESLRQLVVIEEGTLTTMARDTRYVTLFPFLGGLTSHVPKKTGCSSCAQRSSQRQIVFNAAKAAIAGMDGEKKRQLKDLLRAKQVRVRYTDGQRVIEKTF